MNKMGKKWGVLAAAIAVSLASATFAEAAPSASELTSAQKDELGNLSHRTDAGTLTGEQRDRRDFGKPGYRWVRLTSTSSRSSARAQSAG